MSVLDISYYSSNFELWTMGVIVSAMIYGAVLSHCLTLFWSLLMKRHLSALADLFTGIRLIDGCSQFCVHPHGDHGHHEWHVRRPQLGRL